MTDEQPAEKKRSKRVYVYWGVALLVIAVALGLLAPSMAPIQAGTPAEFWYAACYVDIGPTTVEDCDSMSVSGIYPPREEWFVYYRSHMHGRDLYRVSRAEAMAHFPEVIDKLKADPEQKHLVRDTPDELFAAIRKAEISDLQKEYPDTDWEDRFRAADEAFAEQWRRAGRYWLNLVFEFAYLGGLLIFVTWPWLKRRGKWAKAIHLGALPLLLFLPLYMGYATYTMTSVGPSGGVLYPWLIVWSHGFPLWTRIDELVLSNMPQVLGPLSQSPGPMLAITGMGFLTPLAAMVIGAVLAAGSLAAGAKRVRQAAAEALKKIKAAEKKDVD